MRTVAPISVAEYHRMIDAGVLTENDRVELIDGNLVAKMPQKPPHSNTARRLGAILLRMTGPDWLVSVQFPMTLSGSEPEPDICVARQDHPGTFDHRHPGPADCGLVVEVANSTLASDRTDKLKIYARDGIPTYWIASVPDRTIEVYEVPNGTREEPVYKTRRVYHEGESIPFFLGGVKRGEIAVSDIFPAPKAD